MASKEITVQKVFDSIPRTSTYQLWVCFICFLVTFLDGFDLTVIGVAVPKIAEFLHAKPSALGLAMAAGQFGPLIGAVVLGMLADRIGRKWMLFASAFVFGFFTLCQIFITSVGQLALLRFIAGLGLGGAVPIALAFGSEYAPSRARKTFVSSMYAGMPTGATLGGLIAAYFIPHYGWQSLFIFGGAIPVLIAITAALFLPESLEFLAGKGDKDQQIRKTFSRIAPNITKDMDYRFIPTEKKLPGVPVKHLFTQGRAIMTVLFLLALTGALYSLYILVSWAPTLLHNSGATVVQYSLAFAALNFGAVIATVLGGRIMDKGNPYLMLEAGFVLGFISLVAFGLFAKSSLGVVVSLSFVAAFFINGSFASLLTVTATSYPTDIRGTAVGWLYAVGKVGAMAAPAIGGYLITQGWTVSRICGTNAFVGLFVALLVVLLQLRVSSAVTSSRRLEASKG